MKTLTLTAIDLSSESESVNAYKNIPVSIINDHVIRLSVMTEPYFWHLHPDSDEIFLVLEGSLFIDLEDKTVELQPNQLFTIPRNVRHRTRPKGQKSVNLTFELEHMTTVRTDDYRFNNI